jgi:hypothetical protein
MESPQQQQRSSENPYANSSYSIDPELRERHRRLFQRGLRWLCAGLGLMGTSFATNYILFHSDQSFEYIMYVLTGMGTLCIIKSLHDMFG